MKLIAHLFGSSSSSKKGRKRRGGGKSGGGGSFGPSSSSGEAAPSESGAEKRPAAAVTRGELEVALRRVVSGEEELAEMLAEAEAAGALLLEEIAAADEGELREAFAVFDADGDGRISAEELRAVLASLGDEWCSVEDCRRMIGGVDTDGDGFVCFDEFTRMMMQ